MKKVIINADDFGYSENVNNAVIQAYNKGILTSTSLLANMDGFNHAVYKIYPLIQTIDIGFHFNIVEGRCLSGSELLCDNNKNFNNGFISTLIKSNNKNFLKAVEIEFRLQIEKVLNTVNISHIDSHRHIHAIPQIFSLITKLSKEYNIKYIRTQKEIPYIVSSKIFNMKFPPNILKSIILNAYTVINRYPYTNTYIIGILYTGYMDENSILKGLKCIHNEESITEIILHPTTDNSRKNNYNEFQTVKNSMLKQKVEDLGFKLIKYSEIR